MGTTILTSTSFVTDIAINRTPKFSNIVQENVSGKETRIARRIIPRWTWDITFNAVRSTAQANSTEFASLTSFYNSLSGGFDSFQWLDPEDNTTTNSPLTYLSAGVYQMARTLGTFSENIFAPSTLTNVTVQGSSGSTVAATFTAWGSSAPGVLTLSTLTPTSTTTVWASFTYYWPVRWDKDEMAFDRFGSGWWEVKKMTFTSII